MSRLFYLRSLGSCAPPVVGRSRAALLVLSGCRVVPALLLSSGLFWLLLDGGRHLSHTYLDLSCLNITPLGFRRLGSLITCRGAFGQFPVLPALLFCLLACLPVCGLLCLLCFCFLPAFWFCSLLACCRFACFTA